MLLTTILGLKSLFVNSGAEEQLNNPGEWLKNHHFLWVQGFDLLQGLFTDVKVTLDVW